MSTIDRRTFLSNGARAGACLCCACTLPGAARLAMGNEEAEAAKPLVPADLNYCGYSCPPDCKFLKGTLDDNVELKKEAWKLWKIEERFGAAFDQDKAICYGCKTEGKPEGFVVSRCTVRDCAQEKKLDCCIECDELEACDKDLWRRFPEFKAQVVEMQQRFRKQS